MKRKWGLPSLLFAAVCMLAACSANAVQEAQDSFPVYSEIPMGALPQPYYPMEQEEAVFSTVEQDEVLFNMPVYDAGSENPAAVGNEGDAGTQTITSDTLCYENTESESDSSSLVNAGCAAAQESVAAADGDCLAEVFPAAKVGAYLSVETEGAVLTVESDGGFSYVLARQYIHLEEEALSFTLTFRASGYLLPSGSGFRLCVTDATVTCDGLNNERNFGMLSYIETSCGSAESVSQYARLISGESLTVDEFYGIGTFALMTEEPIVAQLDAEGMTFTLNRPLAAPLLRTS